MMQRKPRRVILDGFIPSCYPKRKFCCKPYPNPKPSTINPDYFNVCTGFEAYHAHGLG